MQKIPKRHKDKSDKLYVELLTDLSVSINKAFDRLTTKFKLRRRIGQSRNIKRAKFLYWYIIIGGIAMFVYFVIQLFIPSWPTWIAFTPPMLLIVMALFIQIKRTWKVIWMGIANMNRGRLLLYLNNNTVFSESHKIKLVHWVYPTKRQIRAERRAELMEKVRIGETLKRIERKQLRRKTVRCPQQLKDGINEAFLVAALIYAHVNISILDGEIRDIMNLTDEHIASFDLQAEIDRCKTKKSA